MNLTSREVLPLPDGRRGFAVAVIVDLRDQGIVDDNAVACHRLSGASRFLRLIAAPASGRNDADDGLIAVDRVYPPDLAAGSRTCPLYPLKKTRQPASKGRLAAWSVGCI